MALGKVGGNQLETTLNIDSGTLYVDGTNNRVGVGTASPSSVLHVGSTATSNNLITLASANNSTAGIDLMGDLGAAKGFRVKYEGNGNYFAIEDNTSSVLTERMRIDSSGNVSIGGNVATTNTGTAAAPNFAISSGALGNNGMFCPAANTIAFSNAATERLRIDSSGNVGIGTSSPVQKFNVDTGDMALSCTTDGDGNDLGEFMFWNRTHAGSGAGTSFVNDVASMQGKMVGTGNNSGGSLHFYTKSDGGSKTERVRVNGGGDTCFNCTSSPTANGTGTGGINQLVTSGDAYNLKHTVNGNTIMNMWQTGTGGCAALSFHKGNTQVFVGSITMSTSSTAYNTSSDYRLKTNVTYDWDATARLKQLRPARFEWIADGDDAVPVDGFLAHEVSDIVPEAITGTKDAVDEDGNIVAQSIDQSKLVPLLVKTIQELEARIAALEAA